MQAIADPIVSAANAYKIERFIADRLSVQASLTTTWG